jgi:hypothetical protein
MPQVIEVPGYGLVEFPDGLNDDAIIAAIRTMDAERPQAAPDTPDPSEGMSPGELFAAGAGSQVRSVGRGIAGFLGPMAARLRGGDPAKVDANMRQQEDEIRRLEGPLMQRPEAQKGAIAGAVTTAVPAMAIPGGQTVLGGAAIGAGMGAIQPVGTADSRGVNIATGAAFGSGVPAAFKVAGRVAQPVRNVLSGNEKAAVTTLRNEGVPLTVAQQTGSRAAQGVERFLSDNPVTGGRMAEELAKRQRAFTRAALRTIGENADTATPEVLGAARARIGGVMDEIAVKYAPNITPHLDALTQISDEASRVLPDGGRRITVQVERIIAKAGADGRIDGRSVQAIRRELEALSKQPDVSGYAVQLREVLDDALHKATQGTDDFKRLQDARRQYRNLMAISDAAGTTADGVIPAGALAQRLKSGKHTRNSFRYGTGDTELSNLARSMSTVLDRFPNSGTAARAGYQLLPGAAAGTASLAMGGDPAEAAKWAALGYAGPQLLARVVNSPASANYLARGLNVPPINNELAQLMMRSGQLVPPYLLANSGN